MKKPKPIIGWALADKEGIWSVRLQKKDLSMFKSGEDKIIPVLITPVKRKEK